MGRGAEFTFGHIGCEVPVRHLSGDVWNIIENVNVELQREVRMGAVDILWFLNINRLNLLWKNRHNKLLIL